MYRTSTGEKVSPLIEISYLANLQIFIFLSTFLEISNVVAKHQEIVFVELVQSSQKIAVQL